MKPTGMRNLRIAKLEIRVELELRNYRVEPKMESICDGTNPEKSLKPEKSEIIPKILRGSYKRILTILYQQFLITKEPEKFKESKPSKKSVSIIQVILESPSRFLENPSQNSVKADQNPKLEIMK